MHCPARINFKDIFCFANKKIKHVVIKINIFRVNYCLNFNNSLVFQTLLVFKVFRITIFK